MDVEKQPRPTLGDGYGSYAVSSAFKGGALKGGEVQANPRWSTRLRMFWHQHRSWALSALISLGLVLLVWPSQLQTRAQTSSRPESSRAVLVEDSEPPRHSTGLTDLVQWDNYTLWLEGQRVFIQ